MYIKTYPISHFLFILFLISNKEVFLMKKLITMILTAALALTLTACDRPKNENSNSSAQSLTPEEQAEYEQFLKEKRDEAMNEIPDDLSLTLLDGSTVTKADIAGWDEMDGLYFDFAFIRYAEPIFEVLDHEPQTHKKIDSPQWLKVKPGEVLKDGNTVLEARTGLEMNPDDGKPMLFAKYIRLSGEITYEGVFDYYNGSGIYGGNDYCYSFYPNSTKYSIPVLYCDDCSYLSSAALHNHKFIYYDGFRFYHFQFKGELRSELNKDKVCEAKITFKDPIFGRARTSEIVRYELGKDIL